MKEFDIISIKAYLDWWRNDIREIIDVNKKGNRAKYRSLGTPDRVG
jgi:hypothetical protein